MPPREIHFFDDDDHFANGVSWYAKELRKGYSDSDKLPLLVGEKTPSYAHNPDCPKRIRRIVPEAKLVWLFREPVKRSFSNYLHERRKGTELRSFRSAVRNEGRRIRNNLSRVYLERSKYALQVERYLDHFDRDQMLFLLFEDLIDEPSRQLDKIAQFLNISRFDLGDATYHANRSVMPLSPLSLWLARKILGLDNTIYRTIRRNDRALTIYQLIRKVNMKLSRPRPVLPSDLEEQLRSSYQPYNKRLAELTALDLAPWYK